MNSMELRSGLFKRAKQEMKRAREGREIWLKIREKHDFSPNDCLLIFPERNRKLNRAVLALLDEYSERRYFEKMVLIIDKSDTVTMSFQKDIRFEPLSADKMQAVLQYAALYKFTKNMAVVSLKSPYGKTNMVGYKGIVFEDYLWDGILA